MNPLIEALHAILAARQIASGSPRRVAYGNDASFYRLVPEVVAIVESGKEVLDLPALAHRHRRSLTFRAPRTSLSGQSASDGILTLVGKSFAGCDIARHGALISLGPGMVGAEANRHALFGRKLNPAPTSITSCKIGGTAAKNIQCAN